MRCFRRTRDVVMVGRTLLVIFRVLPHPALDEGHLTPISSRRILMRICANLHQIYSMLEQPDEVFRFQRYLVALAK